MRPSDGPWETQQEHLRAQREHFELTSAERAYHAGRVRGSRGEIETPPWMGHLHELFPAASAMSLQQFQDAHRYGQTEGYVEKAPDLIEQEFRPRAEKIAHHAEVAQNRLDNAVIAYRSRGILALSGHSRYPMAPSARRHRAALDQYNKVQAEAEQLHGELNDRLGAVETLRNSLKDMPWQPPRRS